MRKQDKVFGRSTRYVVMPVEAVRAFNIRNNEEVAEAQNSVDDDMLQALEEMVNAARSEKLLDRDAVLALGAAAW